MNETFTGPVPLSKGIKLSELSKGSEFHIDLDFKKKTVKTSLNMDDDFMPDVEDDDDDDDDGDEDILKIMEDSAEKSLLTSPEYHTFAALAAKMIDCLPNGDCKILIIEEGNGPLIPFHAEVTMHYAAYWETANIPFDSTLTMNGGAPTRVRLGCGRVLPGLEVALTSVRGPTCRFHVLLQPAAAWGALGAPPRIRPEPALFVCVVYDVRDVDAGVRFNDLPSTEQCKYEVTQRTVKSLHAEAKDQFAKKRYVKAISNYQQSINVLNVSKPETEDEITEVMKLKTQSILNLTVCYSKLNKPSHVFRTLESLDLYIDIEKHCKALFYYGKAYELKGDVEKALEYYNKAKKLEPNNKDIGKALDNLDSYLNESAKNEKEMWRNLFQTKVEEKFDVDKDFQDEVREMFQELAKSEEYASFDLPGSLNKNQTDFIKSLTREFENFVVLEKGEGKKKQVTIVKKLS